MPSFSLTRTPTTSWALTICGAFPGNAARCRSMPRPRRWRDLERVFEFAFKGTESISRLFETRAAHCLRTLLFGETKITPLPVPHGEAETVNGYCLSRTTAKSSRLSERLQRVPDEIAQKIFGRECLIIDALRDKPHPTHLSVGQALEVATRVQPKKPISPTLRMSCRNRLSRTLPPHTHIAYDGLKLSFDENQNSSL